MRNAVLIHLLGVVVWVGGMFFAHVCLRPIAASQLPPPQRLPLLAAVLGRFFTAAGVAVVAILVTGLLRFGQVGGAATPWQWRAMAATGSVMMLLYLLVVLRYYPRLTAAVATQTWPAGAAAMDAIRRLVLVNLILGVLTIAIALFGR